MSDWTTTQLNEIANVQTGPFGSQLKNEQYIVGGTPVVTVEHIVNHRIVDFEYPSVTEDDRKRLSKYLVREGDIIFTRVGSVDLSAYVQKHQSGWMFSSRMLRVRVNSEEIDERFLSYFFQQRNFKEYILSISVGATMPSINTEILESVQISYPPLPEQKVIASILSSLDDKIDLLHRQNKTLEAMAETLFRQWFVEDAKEDWEEGVLGDIASFKNGKNRPSESDNGTIPIYGGNGILGMTNIPNSNGETIVIGRVGAYCGSVFIENRSIWVTDNALIAKPLNKLTMKFLYYFLKWSDLNSMAEGSSHPLLTQKLLTSIPLTLPRKELLEKFNLQIVLWHQKQNANRRQIETLENLRDTLLPKLMSGEVRVKMDKPLMVN